MCWLSLAFLSDSFFSFEYWLPCASGNQTVSTSKYFQCSYFCISTCRVYELSSRVWNTNRYHYLKYFYNLTTLLSIWIGAPHWMSVLGHYGLVILDIIKLFLSSALSDVPFWCLWKLHCGCVLYTLEYMYLKYLLEGYVGCLITIMYIPFWRGLTHGCILHAA